VSVLFAIVNRGEEANGTLFQHLNWLRTRGLRESTIYQRRNAIFRFRESVGCSPLEASREQVEAWWSRLPGTPHTRCVELSHIKSFIKWGIKQELTSEDTTARIERPKVPRRLPRPISEEQLKLALGNADARMRFMLCLAAFGGLRCCEIALVEWGDVRSSPDGPLLSIPEGKGGHSRVVPLHPDAHAAMEQMAGVRRGRVLKRLDGRPGPVTASRVSKEINEYLHGLGVSDTAHSLRHRFGTVLFHASKDIVLTKNMMGHQSISTTSGYVALDASRAKEMIDRLPRFG
jgi:site-specific recombinase XerD